MSSIFDFHCTAINGMDKSLADFKGQVLLVVNTASKCGFTPQFKGLEDLYGKYKDQGFSVLGFPCNQFGGQDPGEDREIAEFCTLNFGVTFPMFSKVEVNGDNASPLFKHLKKAAPGVLGSEGIKWNFTKFLVDRNGVVRERFAPATSPESVEKAIEALLKETASAA
ncbi:MAG: glutathione peroxidase [Gammaproteobacteria bacterium]|nr:MAG: glutathione peroxidase [Gammaproteobacteria bacterium]